MSKEEIAKLPLMLVNTQELEWGEPDEPRAWPDSKCSPSAYQEMLEICFERR